MGPRGTGTLPLRTGGPSATDQRLLTAMNSTANSAIAQSTLTGATESATAETSTTSARTGSGYVIGIAVDGEGKPVSGGTVTLIRQNWEPYEGPHADTLRKTTTTDDTGRFEFYGLPYDIYRIQTTKENQMGVRTANVFETGTSQSRIPDQILHMDIEASGPIAGSVRDAAGNPISGAVGDYSRITARTDSDGKYTLSGLTEGAYHVQVSHPEYSPQSRGEVPAGTQGVDFRLEGLGNIEGRVFAGATNNPVTDFDIMDGRGSFTRVNHEQGNFRLTGIPVGEFIINVRASGYAPGSQPVQGVRADQTVTGVVVRLDAGAIVAGIVLNSDGQPVAGANVLVDRAPDEVGQVYTARLGETVTRQDGTFRLDSLSAVTSKLTATHPEYAPGSTEVALAAGQTTEARLVLSQGGIVEGRVTVVGQATAQAFVSVRGMDMARLDQNKRASR
ncbi:MAG: carboxypeptidase regulatory-like domain-containing protein [Candidatus Hydrogenedentes bacterium]|nr:carboxypeptidase regulatory-like domain-containing protein [Candidatus Hydrogenedentota bacterium]